MEQKTNEEKKFHWIDDSIEFDFPIPRMIQELMDEAEKLDLADDWAYFNYAEAIEDDLKEYILQKKLTRKQCALITKKYGGW